MRTNTKFFVFLLIFTVLSSSFVAAGFLDWFSGAITGMASVDVVDYSDEEKKKALYEEQMKEEAERQRLASKVNDASSDERLNVLIQEKRERADAARKAAEMKTLEMERQRKAAEEHRAAEKKKQEMQRQQKAAEEHRTAVDGSTTSGVQATPDQRKTAEENKKSAEEHRIAEKKKQEIQRQRKAAEMKKLEIMKRRKAAEEHKATPDQQKTPDEHRPGSDDAGLMANAPTPEHRSGISDDGEAGVMANAPTPGEHRSGSNDAGLMANAPTPGEHRSVSDGGLMANSPTPIATRPGSNDFSSMTPEQKKKYKLEQKKQFEKVKEEQKEKKEEFKKEWQTNREKAKDNMIEQAVDSFSKGTGRDITVDEKTLEKLKEKLVEEKDVEDDNGKLIIDDSEKFQQKLNEIIETAHNKEQELEEKSGVQVVYEKDAQGRSKKKIIMEGKTLHVTKSPADVIFEQEAIEHVEKIEKIKIITKVNKDGTEEIVYEIKRKEKKKFLVFPFTQTKVVRVNPNSGVESPVTLFTRMTAIFNGNDSVDKDEDKSDLLSTTVQAVPHIPGAEMVGTNSEESSEERTSEEEAPEEEQEEIASCTETDSGYASYAGGTMTHTFSHISSPVTDYCIDDNTVMEYYCSPTLYPTDPANQRNFHESNCPYGCTTDANGGRCLYESEVQAPTEEGAPEEEAEPQGAAEPPAEENGPTNTYAFCIGKVEGMHCTIDSGIVATVPCDGNGNLGGATVICQSPEVCTEDVGQGNAECSEEPLAEEEPTAPICTDTDGGNEPTVSGITEGVRGSMGLHVDEDICSGTLGVNRRLREYYCVDDINSDFDWYYCECVDVDGNGQSVPGYCP